MAETLTGKVIAFSYYGLIKTGDFGVLPFKDTNRGETLTHPDIRIQCVNDCITPTALSTTSDGCGNQSSLYIGRRRAGAMICGPFTIEDNLIGCTDDCTNGRVGLVVQCGSLKVQGPINVQSCENLDGPVSNYIGGCIDIACDTNIGGDLNVTCNTDIGGTLNVCGATTINNTLSVTGDTDIGGNLNVTCNTDIGGTLNVTCNTNICGLLTTNGGFTAAGTSNINGDLTVNGDIRATGDVIAFFSSDERLKNNLKRIENSNTIINSLTGYEYNWDGDKVPHRKDECGIGILAQDAQKVIPNIVVERDNGYLAVDYTKLIPVLIEEVKNINNRVTALESQ